jgi:stringent starvation protein B
MISNRPYMIRAMYDWIVDNGWTPHFQVDADYPSVQVPQQFVQEGVIVLNAHPEAVFGLLMDNDGFSFKARFQGVEEAVFFPPEAVLAVFARENGQGMPFPPEPYPNEADEPEENTSKLAAVESEPEESKEKESKKTAATKSKAKNKKPSLSVVK